MKKMLTSGRCGCMKYQNFQKEPEKDCKRSMTMVYFIQHQNHTAEVRGIQSKGDRVPRNSGEARSYAGAEGARCASAESLRQKDRAKDPARIWTCFSGVAQKGQLFFGAWVWEMKLS